MGMETLNTAARAAGYSMASDEFLNEGKREPQSDANSWRSGEAVLPAERQERGSVIDWIKSWFGGVGRRATA